jgi:hypothetical protein
LLKLRAVIGPGSGKSSPGKLIGNALEAAVVLHCDERLANAIPKDELEEFFILSDLKLEAAQERVPPSLSRLTKSARAAGGTARPSAPSPRIRSCAIVAPPSWKSDDAWQRTVGAHAPQTSNGA